MPNPVQSPKPGSLFWRLWWRALSVKRPQAVLALGSLLVGAAVASLLLNLYSDARRKMTQEFRAYGANVVLAPRAQAAAGIEPPAATIDERSLAPLRTFAAQTPGLFYAPILYSVVRVARADADSPAFQNAVAAGTDFPALRRIHSGWRGTPAPGQSGADYPAGHECALGAHLAERLSVRAGGSVALAPMDITSPAPVTFRVIDLLSAGTAEDDQVFLPTAGLQSLVGMRGKISLVQVSIPGETAEIERAVGELARLLPGPDVRPVRQIVYSEGKVLGTIRWLLLSLTALILVIIALCVVATMTAIVTERRRDIAVMKALGATDAAIARLFLAEGAGLGLVGGALGFALGSWLAANILRRLFGVSLRLHFWTFPEVCGLTTLLAVVATFLVVRIVRTIQPAVALKVE